MFVASLFFSEGEIIFMVWSVILFAGYLLILYALGEITKNDFDYIKQIATKKKKSEIQEELSGNEPTA